MTDALPVTVVGLGYVGLSLAVLLARRHAVRALDIDAARVAAIAAGQSPLADPGITAALAAGGLDLTPTTDPGKAYDGTGLVIVATPTDYDGTSGSFDTRSVEAVIAEATARAPGALVAVKSTVPVGFTDRMRARHPGAAILFSPEFLREGQALADNLAPSRIVVGDRGPAGARFAALLSGLAESAPPVLLTDPAEAEAIKLFSNTYLAMRVAFFNELDSYALGHDLDAGRIVRGVSLDPRIGAGYNNPSFGYGGYCLPKDTRQLVAQYGTTVRQNLIGAVVDANETRKDTVARAIAARAAGDPALAGRPVGIYRLVMKAGSDNTRDSSVLGILDRLVAQGVPVIVHEPLMPAGALPPGTGAEPDLARFKARAGLIVANRRGPDLADVEGRLFTRDLTGDN